MFANLHPLQALVTMHGIMGFHFDV